MNNNSLLDINRENPLFTWVGGFLALITSKEYESICLSLVDGGLLVEYSGFGMKSVTTTLSNAPTNFIRRIYEVLVQFDEDAHSIPCQSFVVQNGDHHYRVAFTFGDEIITLGLTRLLETENLNRSAKEILKVTDSEEPIFKWIGELLAVTISEAYHSVCLSLVEGNFLIEYYRFGVNSYFKVLPNAEPNLIHRIYKALVKLDEDIHPAPRQSFNVRHENRSYRVEFILEDEIITLKLSRLMETEAIEKSKFDDQIN